MKNILLGSAAAFLLCSFSFATTARAQGAGDKAAAQTLFDEGRKLMEEGHFAEACPKLESSQKLDPGAGTLLNLAACYEKNGQTASAWVTYTDAASASAGRHPDWVEKARAKAAALEPTLARLTLNVRSTVAGLVVKRDGAVVASGAFDVAIPVDPGRHEITAVAPGRRAYATTVTLAAGQLISADVPELDVDANTTTADAPTSSGSGQRIAGLSVAGAGVVGLVFGTVFGVKAAGWDKDTASKNCSADFTVCNTYGKSIIDGAHSDALISSVALGVGAAFIVGGAVLFFTAPKAEKKALALSAGHAGGPLGLTLAGSF